MRRAPAFAHGAGFASTACGVYSSTDLVNWSPVSGLVTGAFVVGQGQALFACSGADFFEAFPLDPPIDRHRLYISNQAHVYPLARVLEQYAPYLVVLADSSNR